jgi:hypothetical protein
MNYRWSRAAALVLTLACAPHPLSRQSWERMNSSDKELYVRTLQGHEAVLTRKGGRGHRYSSAPSLYVRRIDERFAAGERRPVEDIWADLADEPVPRQRVESRKQK